MRRSIYYRDPLNDDFASHSIKKKPLPEDYRYLPQSPAERAADFMLYHAVAVPLVFLLQKICYGERIVNRQALKPYLNSGCFLYGNHTRGAGDAFCPTETAFPRKPYIVTSSDAVALPLIRGLVKALGGLPVPDSLHGLRQFRKTVDGLAEKGNCIVIYPEAHIWPLYTDIRPFPDTSFCYPAETGKPVFAFTVTYKKRAFLPLVRSTVYVDGPFFADEGLSLRQKQKQLRDMVYNAMKQRSAASDYSYHRYTDISGEDGDCGECEECEEQ